MLAKDRLEYWALPKEERMGFIAAYWWLWLLLTLVFGIYLIYNVLRRTNGVLRAGDQMLRTDRDLDDTEMSPPFRIRGKRMSTDQPLGRPPHGRALDPFDIARESMFGRIGPTIAVFALFALSMGLLLLSVILNVITYLRAH